MGHGWKKAKQLKSDYVIRKLYFFKVTYEQHFSRFLNEITTWGGRREARRWFRVIFNKMVNKSQLSDKNKVRFLHWGKTQFFVHFFEFVPFLCYFGVTILIWIFAPKINISIYIRNKRYVCWFWTSVQGHVLYLSTIPDNQPSTIVKF